MKQALPLSFALVILIIDYISVFINICVITGLLRAAKRETFHVMQYSACTQTICTLLLCIQDIFSKHELISQNWSIGYLYFDGINIAVTNTVWIHYTVITLFHLICVPIYAAGMMQVLALDFIISPKHTWIKAFLLARPFIFFTSGMIPGIILCIIYWIEIYCRGIQGYTTAGFIFLPSLISYTLWITFVSSLLITFYAGFKSLSTAQKIQKYEKRAKKANQTIVPKALITQVLMIGISLPAVGFIKAFEVLIWVFPSAINVYFSVFAIVFQASAPIINFINCGSNTNVYPLVPVFSPVLRYFNEKLIVTEEKSKKESSSTTSHVTVLHE